MKGLVNKLSATAKTLPVQSYYDLQRTRKKFYARKQHQARLAVKKMRMLGMAVLVAILAVVLVSLSAAVVQLNYRLEARTGELRALQDAGRHLKLKSASLRSPERLEKIALEEIGLQYPAQAQVVILTAERITEAGN
jgi:cell division protein FtsL